MLILAD